GLGQLSPARQQQSHFPEAGPPDLPAPLAVGPAPPPEEEPPLARQPVLHDGGGRSLGLLRLGTSSPARQPESPAGFGQRDADRPAREGAERPQRLRRRMAGIPRPAPLSAPGARV